MATRKKTARKTRRSASRKGQPSPKRKSPKGVGKPRRAPSVRVPTTAAARLRKARRSIGTNVNYQYWIQGFIARHAAETGKVLTPTQATRHPDFKRAADIVLSSGPRTSRKRNSPLANALEQLGMRDPNFRGLVGNSPDVGSVVRARSRGSALGRRGISSRRNTP